VGSFEKSDIEASLKGKHQFYSAMELAASALKYEKWATGEESNCKENRKMLLSMITSIILCHHDRKSKVRFDQNPLGYLLILSDELHEIGRPSFSYTRQRLFNENDTKMVVLKNNEGPVKKVSVSLSDQKELKITYYHKANISKVDETRLDKNMLLTSSLDTDPKIPNNPITTIKVERIPI
jgi:hypothetical protein